MQASEQTYSKVIQSDNGTEHYHISRMVELLCEQYRFDHEDALGEE